MEALYEVLSSLVKGEAVLEKYKPHELTGNYKGCMECHVGNDLIIRCLECRHQPVCNRLVVFCFLRDYEIASVFSRIKGMQEALFGKIDRERCFQVPE